MYLFFAGSETEKFFEAAYSVGHRRFLVSYLYLRKNKKDMLKNRKRDYPDAQFFIDSGAATILHGGVGSQHGEMTIAQRKAHAKKSGIGDPNKYVEEYVEWLKENADSIVAATEFDVDDPQIGMVTNAQLRKWQDKLFLPLQEQKIPIILVWHPWHGIPTWESYCKRSSYVGNPPALLLPAAFATARKHKTKVHGFGMTSLTELNHPKWPYYSVDSTTWLLTVKFGKSFVFNGAVMRKVERQHKQFRNLLFRQAKEAGLDWEKIKQDDYMEILKLGALQWTRFAQKIERSTVNKAYWNSPNNPKSENDPSKAPYNEAPSLNEPSFSVDAPTPPPEPQNSQNVAILLLKAPEDIKKMEMEDLLAYGKSLGVRMDNRAVGGTSLEEVRGYLVECLEVLRGDTQAIEKWEEGLLGEYIATLGGVPTGNLEEDIPLYRSLLTTPPEQAKYPKPRSWMPGKPGAPMGNTNALKHGLYSARTPTYACDTCPNTSTCPEYKEGHVCAYIEEFDKLGLQTFDQAVSFLRDMIITRAQRAHHASVLEKMDGGYSDPTVTGELQSLTEHAHLLARLLQAPTAPPPPAPGNNILLQLFGGSPSQDIKAIDAQIEKETPPALAPSGATRMADLTENSPVLESAPVAVPEPENKNASA